MGMGAVLHFLAEFDHAVDLDRTMYLVDGRPLSLEGPSLQALNLPAGLIFGELCGVFTTGLS